MSEAATCVVPDCQRPAGHSFRYTIQRRTAVGVEAIEVKYDVCSRCKGTPKARRAAKEIAERRAVWTAMA